MSLNSRQMSANSGHIIFGLLVRMSLNNGQMSLNKGCYFRFLSFLFLLRRLSFLIWILVLFSRFFFVLSLPKSLHHCCLKHGNIWVAVIKLLVYTVSQYHKDVHHIAVYSSVIRLPFPHRHNNTHAVWKENTAGVAMAVKPPCISKDNRKLPQTYIDARRLETGMEFACLHKV